MFLVTVVVAGRPARLERRIFEELPVEWQQRAPPFFDSSAQLDILVIQDVLDDADKENIPVVDAFFGVDN